MDWIFEHIQVAVILLIVVVTLVRKVFDTIVSNKPAAGANPGNPPPPHAVPNEVDPTQWPEPPPPPPKIPTPPPLRKISPPEDGGSLATELERQRAMQERLRKIRESKSSIQPVAATPVLTPPPTRPVGSLPSSLRGGKQLRRAIVIKEIIGPPLGLR